VSQPQDNTIRAVPLLRALEARLRAMRWTFPGGDAALFGVVKVYDIKELALAMTEAVSVEQRAAFVVFHGSLHANERQGQVLMTETIRQVTILVTDRNLGDRNVALMGSGRQPGIYEIADLVRAGIAGTLTVPEVDAAGGVDCRAWCSVMNSQLSELTEKRANEEVGRATMDISVDIHCGTMQTDLGVYAA
jgi:hypothetical protein